MNTHCTRDMQHGPTDKRASSELLVTLVKELGRIGDHLTVSVLRRATQHYDGAVREAATKAIYELLMRRMGDLETQTRALVCLFDMKGDKSHYAQDALDKLGQNAIPLLTGALADVSAWQMASKRLVTIGLPAAQSLLKAMDDGSSPKQWRATEALVGIVERCTDLEQVDKFEFALAVESRKPDNVIRPVEEALKKKKKQLVDDATIESLACSLDVVFSWKMVSGKLVDIGLPAAQTLFTALDDESLPIHCKAAETLEAIVRGCDAVELRGFEDLLRSESRKHGKDKGLTANVMSALRKAATTRKQELMGGTMTRGTFKGPRSPTPVKGKQKQRR